MKLKSVTLLCCLALAGWAQAQTDVVSTRMRPVEEAAKVRTIILNGAPDAVNSVPEVGNTYFTRMKAELGAAGRVHAAVALDGEVAPVNGIGGLCWSGRPAGQNLVGRPRVLARRHGSGQVQRREPSASFRFRDQRLPGGVADRRGAAVRCPRVPTSTRSPYDPHSPAGGPGHGRRPPASPRSVSLPAPKA